MTCLLRAGLIIVVVVVIALPPSLLQAQVPSSNQVLHRFITALGGKSELEKIHTMILRGRMDLPELKKSGTTIEYFEYPDRFAAITNIPGYGTSKLVFDGHQGWQFDAHNKFTQLSGPTLDDVKRRAHIHWNLKLREFYPNVQVKGREVVDGEDTWKLEASEGNSTYSFFFNVKTGLLMRFETDQQVPRRTSSVSISDYRRVGKVLFAFGAAQTSGPVKWKRELSEVRFNVPIDDSVFLAPQTIIPQK